MRLAELVARRSRNLTAAVALLAAAASASGCWAGQNAAASAEYARQVSTATLRVAQLEAEVAKSEQRIRQLEEVIRIQGQSEATRLENIDQVNLEVARLRGAIEVLQFQLQDLQAFLEDEQIAQERRHAYAEKRLGALEGFLGRSAPPPPTDEELGITGVSAIPVRTPEQIVAGEGPDGAEPVRQELPASAAAKLELAIDQMEAGDQAGARAILQQALSAHAGEPEIAEIRYRYAETFLNEESWRPAILEFKRVIDNHPDSEWACWAYYRQGEAMERISGIQDARLFYSGATAGSCRNSEAAKAARKKL